MTFAYQGTVERKGVDPRECGSSAIVELLSSVPPPARELDAACAALRIDVRVEGERLVCEGASGTIPLDQSRARDATARALVAAARVASSLHASGRVHGDLRPETVRLSDDGPKVVVAGPVDPARMLRARIAAGAALSDSGYVAPEVLHGEEPTVASDVYAISALAFASMTGRPPLGAVDMHVLHPFGEPLAEVVRAGLSADPRHRPAMGVLADRLHVFAARAAFERQRSPALPAEPAASTESASGRESPGHPNVPALPLAPHVRSPEAPENRGSTRTREREAMSEQHAASSTLLSLILVVGGACVFLGVLALAVTQWRAVGDSGQLTLLTAFSLLTVATGLGFSRRGFSRSGFTLELVGLELFWAVAYHALSTRGLARSLEAWTVTSAFIGASHAVFSAWRRSSVVAASSVVAFSLTAISFGVDFAADSPRSAALYAGIVGAAHAAVALAARRLDRPLFARPFALGAFVWIAGSIIAMVALLVDGHGAASHVLDIAWPYFLCGGSMWVIGFAVPAWKLDARRIGFGSMALLPSVQAVLLGGASGSWVTITALMVVVSLAVSIAASRSLAKGDGVSSLGALTGSGWIVLGALRAVVDFTSDGAVSSAAWPFLAATIAFAAAFLLARATTDGSPTARKILVATGVALALLAPSVEVVVAHWGDTPLAVQGILVVTVAHLSLLAASRTEKWIGRGWALPFSLVAVLWTVSTSAGALREVRGGFAPAALWPFVTSFASIAVGRLLARDEARAVDGTMMKVPPPAAAILGWSAGLVLLAAPSALVEMADLASLGFWVPGTLALAGTALAGIVSHLLIDARLAGAKGAKLSTLSTLSIGFVVVCVAWLARTTELSFREVASETGYLSLAAVWPYLIVVAVLGGAALVRKTRPALASAARTVGLALAALSATSMALVGRERIGFTVFAALVGHTILVVSGRRLRGAAADGDTNGLRSAELWIGAACALIVPAMLCLTRCTGTDAGSIFAATGGPRPIGYLTVFLVDVAILFAVLPSIPGLPKAAARGLEVAASTAFFGTIGLLALPHLESDYLYMATFFVGGAAILLFGMAKRRVVFVASAACALLAGLFVEYFAKLYREVHWGLLALGFGAALLVCALLFERKVKPLLPAMSRWS